jgi:hypothetical protein
MKKYFFIPMLLISFSCMSNASWLENIKSFVNDKIEALKQKWGQLEQQAKQKYEQKALQLEEQKQRKKLMQNEFINAEFLGLSAEERNEIKNATIENLPLDQKEFTSQFYLLIKNNTN